MYRTTRKAESIEEAREIVAAVQKLGGRVRGVEVGRFRWEEFKRSGSSDTIMGECDVVGDLPQRGKTLKIKADGQIVAVRPVASPSADDLSYPLLRVEFEID